ELAHRLTVPGHEARVAARADLDERCRPALFRAIVELLCVGGVSKRTWKLGDAAERRQFGHAPGLDDPKAVSALECLDERLRDGGAADVHRANRRYVVLACMRIQKLQHTNPDGGHAGSHRHALALE